MNVQTSTSKGVKITVTPAYYEGRTGELNTLFMHHYHVEIENRNSFSIQLISRHWKVIDILYPTREVDGEGVIGQQPIIESGELFQYTSACDMSGMFGSMEGFYLFSRLDTRETFKAEIPKFHLIFPAALN